MILDHPIDPEAIKNLSETERTKLVQQAFVEFAQIVQTAKTSQTGILQQALNNVEQQQIKAVLAEIQSLPTS